MTSQQPVVTLPLPYKRRKTVRVEIGECRDNAVRERARNAVVFGRRIGQRTRTSAI